MKYLLLGLQLFPAILAALKAAELHINLPGSGSEKLALITGVAEGVYESVGSEISKDYSRESVLSLIVSIVGRVVAVFNRLGIFEKPAN